jgi:hypothetical protein
MSMLPRMVKVIGGVILATIVSDPAVRAGVHVWPGGMARLVRYASGLWGRAARGSSRFCNRVRRRRSVRGNMPPADGLVHVTSRWSRGVWRGSRSPVLRRRTAATLLGD